MADILNSTNDHLEEDVTIILPDFDVSTIERHGLIFTFISIIPMHE